MFSVLSLESRSGLESCFVGCARGARILEDENRIPMWRRYPSGSPNTARHGEQDGELDPD